MTNAVFERVLTPRTRSRRTVAIVTPYVAPKVGGVEQYTERITQAIAHEPDLHHLSYHHKSAADIGGPSKPKTISRSFAFVRQLTFQIRRSTCCGLYNFGGSSGVTTSML